MCHKTRQMYSPAMIEMLVCKKDVREGSISARGAIFETENSHRLRTRFQSSDSREGEAVGWSMVIVRREGVRG